MDWDNSFFAFTGDEEFLKLEDRLRRRLKPEATHGWFDLPDGRRVLFTRKGIVRIDVPMTFGGELEASIVRDAVDEER